MEMITTTPFGARPISACLAKHMLDGPAPVQIPEADKWGLYREVCTARAALGVTDRDLTVLNALLSFFPEKTLTDTASLIVFPSNAALSERAHGMPESTLRRHVAALVNAGLIRRHDSPNGKRYAARSRDGTITRAFGFDLRPLLERAGEIEETADQTRAVTERLKRLREELVVHKRDAIKLLAYGQNSAPDHDWSALETRLLDLHKHMRRKLPEDLMIQLCIEVKNILTSLGETLSESEGMSGTDRQTERHYQNSNKDSYEIEILEEASTDKQQDTRQDIEPAIPLTLVLKACPDILPYAQHTPRNWRDLIALAGIVRGMMGITNSAWNDAIRTMGAEAAAICIAGILQNVDTIRSPGGYLRALSRKAEAGTFSPAPMVMALL